MPGQVRVCDYRNNRWALRDRIPESEMVPVVERDLEHVHRPEGEGRAEMGIMSQSFTGEHFWADTSGSSKGSLAAKRQGKELSLIHI